MKQYGQKRSKYCGSMNKTDGKKWKRGERQKSRLSVRREKGEDLTDYATDFLHPEGIKNED